MPGQPSGHQQGAASPATHTDAGLMSAADKAALDALVAGGSSPTGPAGGDLTGTFPNPSVKASVLNPAATVPGAYPYTTVDGDTQVNVDSAGGARTIKLGDGSTEKHIVIADTGANAASNNITVSLANTGKKLNGVTNGTLTIATSGALRGVYRDTSGNWIGG